jgi:hypothetical protein
MNNVQAEAGDQYSPFLGHGRIGAARLDLGATPRKLLADGGSLELCCRISQGAFALRRQ